MITYSHVHVQFPALVLLSLLKINFLMNPNKQLKMTRIQNSNLNRLAGVMNKLFYQNSISLTRDYLHMIYNACGSNTRINM